MKIPTIHDNGTSPVRLMEAIAIARELVEKSIEALHETAPNARDYYVQGPSAFGPADDEHRARLIKLDDVRKELERIQEGIMEQVEEIAKRRAGRRGEEPPFVCNRCWELRLWSIREKTLAGNG